MVDRATVHAVERNLDSLEELAEHPGKPATTAKRLLNLADPGVYRYE